MVKVSSFLLPFSFFAGFPIRPVLFSSVCVTHAGHWFQKMKLFTFYLFVAILTQLLIPFFLQSGTEALNLLIQGYSA